MTATYLTTLTLPVAHDLTPVKAGSPYPHLDEDGRALPNKAWDIDVYLDPDLPTLGRYNGMPYGNSRITLREWDQQALLHEVLHIAVGCTCQFNRDPSDPHDHRIVFPLEVMLAPFVHFPHPEEDR